jgi:hypothetical protein
MYGWGIIVRAQTETKNYSRLESFQMIPRPLETECLWTVGNRGQRVKQVHLGPSSIDVIIRGAETALIHTPLRSNASTQGQFHLQCLRSLWYSPLYRFLSYVPPDNRYNIWGVVSELTNNSVLEIFALPGCYEAYIGIQVSTV